MIEGAEGMGGWVEKAEGGSRRVEPVKVRRERGGRKKAQSTEQLPIN